MPGAQPAAAHLHANLLHDADVKRWLTGFIDLWLRPAVNGS
jgi:hypothetical protein